MAGHRDVGEVPVHTGRRQQEGAFDGRALRLVDGRRVPVVQRGVIGKTKLNFSPFLAIESRGNSVVSERGDRGERSVLYSKFTTVLEKHYAVARCEHSLYALNDDGGVILTALACSPNRNLDTQ